MAASGFHNVIFWFSETFNMTIKGWGLGKEGLDKFYKKYVSNPLKYLNKSIVKQIQFTIVRQE